MDYKMNILFFVTIATIVIYIYTHTCTTYEKNGLLYGVTVTVMEHVIRDILGVTIHERVSCDVIYDKAWCKPPTTNNNNNNGKK